MLTDAACRTAKASTKNRKLSDSGGLFLLVRTTGSKSWKYKYRLRDGREKLLTIGSYPQTSLSEARKARDLAREQLVSGIDPSAEKKRRKAADALAALETFEAVARA
ncbi:Arm DNA-binding domain-containing protein [uncultured Croceicoccus sp.]|uniref:Arm DNA-binding domain-containing protein n=1 Tax=uncultured Croceicoccus sp. TaxID=1295329 RepID=UPI002625E476|nr:Arm DNA-binding domain-containing protein [uncultured Croceicoccus sp.]